jgi:hypothetical protein
LPATLLLGCGSATNLGEIDDGPRDTSAGQETRPDSPAPADGPRADSPPIDQNATPEAALDAPLAPDAGADAAADGPTASADAQDAPAAADAAVDAAPDAPIDAAADVLADSVVDGPAPDLDPGCTSLDMGLGAPATPSVLEPPPGPADLPRSKIRVLATPYNDPDGDLHLESAFEIWLAPMGVPNLRVWSATLPSTRSAVIAQGSFDTPFVQLESETKYAARVRYREDRGGGACSEWSAWSPWRVFDTNDDQSELLYDPDVIRTFALTITQPSWDQINAECCPTFWYCIQPPFGNNQTWNRNYYTADLTVDGQTFTGVGLHIKGGCGSSRSLDQKAGFKINLMWDDPNVAGCPAQREFLGETHFTLNNEVQDATQTHDRMAYRLFRDAGVPAPRAVAAEVTVNGENWGPYVLVETIDRRFYKKWMPTNNGMAYDTAPWCELNEDEVPPGIDDPSCFDREFDNRGACDMVDPAEDPTDWELLRTFTQDLATMPLGMFHPQVATIMEYDNFLREYAAEGVLGHWDGYAFDLRNNYRVYHEPTTDRWTMLPSGTDQTFGTDVDPWAATGFLATRCLGETDCEPLFAEKLDAMADLFEWLDFRSQAIAIRSQIEGLIAADPRKEYNLMQYDAANASTLAFIDGRPARIRAYLAAHGY